MYPFRMAPSTALLTASALLRGATLHDPERRRDVSRALVAATEVLARQPGQTPEVADAAHAAAQAIAALDHAIALDDERNATAPPRTPLKRFAIEPTTRPTAL